jgi:hypothetical protein
MGELPRTGCLDLPNTKRNPHMPPESRSQDGNGASREGAKARRGKTGSVFAFFAASRATETVPHAKARRHEEEKLGQSSRSSRLRALRGRCLTRRHEDTKKKNWVSLRVLRGFARYGDGASREGAKARRGKTGAVFAFFAASRATETVPHAKARRHEERRPVKLRVLRGFARDFLLDLHEAEKMRSPGDC